jgi:hypothetical protein
MKRRNRKENISNFTTNDMIKIELEKKDLYLGIIVLKKGSMEHLNKEDLINNNIEYVLFCATKKITEIEGIFYDYFKVSDSREDIQKFYKKNSMESVFNKIEEILNSYNLLIACELGRSRSVYN